MVALKPHLAGRAIACWRLKQERRGGIETGAPGASCRAQTSKQERRGGIETRAASSPRAGPGGKQERRGGIETFLCEHASTVGSYEAGTPWWH